MRKKEKAVGFFGGTFDPIHFGHLHLALQMMEKHELDEVLFCPAALSPFKGNQPPPHAKEHRRRMVELAISPIERFSLLERELLQDGPSYTIETIRWLISKKEATRFHLILGEDALEHLSHWKEFEELLTLAPPLIGSRLREVKKIPSSLASVANLIEEGLTPIPILEISSTMLRDRLKKHLYCGHLIPAKVLDYIEENDLYSFR
jgi:nicotinate-nucleotide adenylyltransferase